MRVSNPKGIIKPGEYEVKSSIVDGNSKYNLFIRINTHTHADFNTNSIVIYYMIIKIR